MTATATATVFGPPIVRGQYNLVDPATGQVAKLQRATNRLKTIDDQAGLNKWLMRTALTGAAAHPDIIAAINAAAGDNRKLDELAEMAREHGGGNTAARLGTAYHSVFEEWNRNLVVPADPEQKQWLEGVIGAIDAAGMTVQQWWVERVVANFASGYAGQIDGAVSLGDGPPVLIDLKTGKDVKYGLNGYAIQLALYAAATHYWDPETNTCGDLPEVNREVGYIIHAPIDGSAVTLYRLDLAAGAEMLDVIDTVMAWRKRKDVGEVVEVAAPPAPVEAPADRLAWIVTAVTELVAAGHGEALAAAWPNLVPTLREARETGVPHSDAELDMIHRGVMVAAGNVGYPFFAHGPYPDGDAFVAATDERIVRLRETIDTLPADLLERLHGYVAEHGVPRLTSGHARRSDVDMVEGWVADLDAEYQARRSLAGAHLGEFDSDVQARVMEVASCAKPQTLTHQACERLGILADAKNLGVVEVRDADLVVGDGAFAVLLKTYDGSKRAVIDAAREAAALYGLARPTSSVQVENNVMLFAATYMATDK